MSDAARRRQQEVEDLFDEVRELPAPEREARIAAADVPDDVRAEVRSLLAFDGETVLQTRVPREAFDASSCIGLSIGGFTIRSIIGSGGMGTVYEAEQERPQRSVALKVLGAAGTKPGVSRRFLRESDFLARLDHPGIARVITAGILRATDGSERPYFAMELVAGGRAITRWVRETQVSREAVLRVFAEACDAVGAGHRAGVAHLDLKPGNILVDAAGRARVIDYGIARSIHEPGDDQERGMIGTPQYMSPEQFARGTQSVDSRADVYALGLILYELATGRLPYETRGLGMKSVARVIASTQPPAPRLVDAHIPRALDAIIRRAIGKSPDARYGTASELADDIRRFLADEPVVAAPPTLLEESLRFVRKRRLLSAVALLALLATISTIAVGGQLVVTSREASERSTRAASIANLRSAAACLREGDPAEGARLLERVRVEDRAWEARHITASIRRFELVASIGSEILHVAVAGGTGEIACGISSGFVTIVDPARPEPYEIHDLRHTFGDSTYRYFPSVSISSDGRKVLAPNAVGKVLYLDRDVGSWREIPLGGTWCGFGRDMLIVADGGTIATIRPDGAKPLAIRSQPPQPVAMSIARNGRFASVLCVDGVVAMNAIDPDSGAIEERWRTPPITRRPRGIAMTDDGRWIVVVTRDGEIVRIDGNDGTIAKRAELAGGPVFEIVASRDGRTLAASSWSSVIRVIDTESLEIRDWVGGTVGHVWGIDFTPDDSRVVARVIVEPLPEASSRSTMEWLGTYRLDAAAGARDIDLGWDVAGAEPRIVNGHAHLIDEQGWLVRASVADGSVERIGEVGTDARLVHRVGDSFYIGSLGGSVARYELVRSDGSPAGSLLERWRVSALPASITALELSPDGTMLACGGRMRAVTMLDVETGSVRWRAELSIGKSGVERQRVSGFVFVDRGTAVVPFSIDSGTHAPVLSIADGRERRVFNEEIFEIDQLAVTADGRLFGLGITGDLFAMQEGVPPRAMQLARNGGIIGTMVEGNRLIVAARDGMLRIATVDSQDGTPDVRRLEGADDLLRLELPQGIPLAVGFDPKRDEVAVVTSRGRIRVWSGKVDERSVPRAGLGQLAQLLADEAARSPAKPR